MGFLKKKTTVGGSVQSALPVSDEILPCLDIEESNISATLFQVNQQTLRLIGYGQVNFEQNICLHTPDTDFNKLSQACFQALKAAKSDWDISLNQLAISLSGSFAKEVTYKNQYRRLNSKQAFSPAEWQQILTSNQTESLQQVLTDFEFEDTKFSQPLELLNSSLVKCSLDGYPVDSPLGRQANFASLQLYNVFLVQSYSKLMQRVAESLRLRLLALAYKPFALARAITGDVRHPDMEAVVVHVDNDCSHVILISGGVLVRSQRFELGASVFDNALKRNLVLRRLTINNLKNSQGDFSFANLEAEQVEEAVKILSHTNSVWLLALITALKSFDVPALPGNIYLTGRGANYSIIVKGLRNPVLSRKLTFKDPVNISHLRLSDVAGVETSLMDLEDHRVMVSAGLAKLTSNLLQKPKQRQAIS